MAATIADLMSSLTTSLRSAVDALPDNEALAPQAEGLSLLATKNELFFSYVQNLVFLIIVKLRHIDSKDEDKKEELAKLNEQVVEKLAELRLYIEKGVKPLEQRLKYQVDKVIRAAEEVSQPQATNGTSKRAPQPKPSHSNDHDDDISGSDASDAASADDSGDDSDDYNELSFRPNPQALLRAAKKESEAAEAKEDGVYRPPKIAPMSMPLTTAQSKEERFERRPAQSRTLDEFVANELSTAPVAEPSIGSTIRAGGRHTLSDRERSEAAEKRRYEEENMIRLPFGGKKERAQAKARQRGEFGGEEWKNIGSGLDRIGKLTKSGNSAKNALARSRKRAVTDGPRDSGAHATTFGKRQKR